MRFLSYSILVAVISITAAVSAHAGLPLSRGMQELARAETLSRASCGRFAMERQGNWKLPRCVLEVRRQVGLTVTTLKPILIGQPLVEKALKIYLDCLDKYLKGLPRMGHESNEVWQIRYQKNLNELDEAHENLADEVSRFLHVSF